MKSIGAELRWHSASLRRAPPRPAPPRRAQRLGDRAKGRDSRAAAIMTGCPARGRVVRCHCVITLMLTRRLSLASRLRTAGAAHYGTFPKTADRKCR